MNLAVDPTGPVVLRLSAPGASAVVYPDVGFNLIDWRVDVGGETVRVLHAEPDVLSGGSGTRSGHPVLFPFPNRIADATYEWDGRTYVLPVAHPGDRHAIHGFAAKRRWTVFEQVADGTAEGEFRLSRDAAEVAGCWPGDLVLRLRYELASDSLTVTAAVTNPDDRPVPFGLGFHPYFAPLGADSPDDTVVAAGARSYWVLDDLIPTGHVAPVGGANDLTTPVRLGDRVLDDVLTGLDPFVAAPDGLMGRASITGAAARLSIRCDESFRDLVVFTPADRASLAVEPYTCPTDAVHLQQSGLDVGWRVLAPGGSWTGVVRHAVTAPA